MANNDDEYAKRYVDDALAGDWITCFGCGTRRSLGFLYDGSASDQMRAKAVIEAQGWRAHGVSSAAPLGTSVFCGACAARGSRHSTGSS